MSTCTSQVAHVVVSENGKYGLANENGRNLLNTQYLAIFPYVDIYKNVYERSGNDLTTKPYPYFIIRNEAKQLAIADQSGKLIFDFITARNLEIDTLTGTVVVTKVERQQAQPFAVLYSFKGEKLDTTRYRRIGYFETNQLIILEGLQSKEVYLLNHQTLNKSGPFDHFNSLNSFQYLSVRQNGLWGVIDTQGRKVLSVQYSQLNWITPDLEHLYASIERPENIIFILAAEFEKHEVFLYDENFNEYLIVESEEGQKQAVPTAN